MIGKWPGNVKKNEEKQPGRLGIGGPGDIQMRRFPRHTRQVFGEILKPENS